MSGFEFGGGGGSIEPPKTGGFGKRAQLTGTILTGEKVRIHGGNFACEVAIFDESFSAPDIATRGAIQMPFVARCFQLRLARRAAMQMSVVAQ